MLKMKSTIIILGIRPTEKHQVKIVDILKHSNQFFKMSILNYYLVTNYSVRYLI